MSTYNDYKTIDKNEKYLIQLSVIQHYKNNEILWNVMLKEYRNRDMRTQLQTQCGGDIGYDGYYI